jgi:hypothetical protein
MLLFTLLLATTRLDAAAEAALAARLIEQLGSPVYAEREAATQALDRLGEPALELLRKASEESGDAEIRRRAERLVATIELRGVRERAIAIRGSRSSPEEKGRKLKVMVKLGMSTAEVRDLLGMPSRAAKSGDSWVASYLTYCLSVRYDENNKVQSVDLLRSKQ